VRIPSWVVLLFFSWHVLAIAIASMPPANQFSRSSVRLESSASSYWPGLAAGFDSALSLTLPALHKMAQLADLGRPYVRLYHRLSGTRQNWSMFGDPPKGDRYMRVRYYVRPSGGGRTWVSTELVWPAHREDRVRFLRSFQNSFRDKAVDNALDRFRERRKPEQLNNPGTRADELPDDLAPIARYFSRRFQRARQLEAKGDQIVRTEVWAGTARTHAPGEMPDSDVRTHRLSVLQDYYAGPVENRIGVPVRPSYHAIESEADIRWVLEYFEEP
jgi:hypothetical protein